jgi:serine/threonine-protein kinase
VVERAKAAAYRAIELDPQLGDAYGALAIIQSSLEWNWEQAEQAFQRARELNPSRADILGFYAMMLMALGRVEEALEVQEAAVRIDPLNRNISDALAAFYYFTGNDKKAYEQIGRGQDLFGPSVVLLQVHGLLHCKQGRYEPGLRLLEEALSLSSGAPAQLAVLAYARGLAGQTEEALHLLEELEERANGSFVSPLSFAIVHAALGQHDRAFDALERAYSMRLAVLPLYASVWPPLEPLRSDSRFHGLLKRIRGESRGVATADEM